MNKNTDPAKRISIDTYDDLLAVGADIFSTLLNSNTYIVREKNTGIEMEICTMQDLRLFLKIATDDDPDIFFHVMEHFCAEIIERMKNSERNETK
jgi:hypothetical protein